MPFDFWERRVSDAANGSGERKGIGEKTAITLRTAVFVVIVCVIPMTLFLAALSAGQSALNKKVDDTFESLKVTIGLLKNARDAQVDGIVHKVDDHEIRIRDLERKK